VIGGSIFFDYSSILRWMNEKSAPLLAASTIICFNMPPVVQVAETQRAFSDLVRGASYDEESSEYDYLGRSAWDWRSVVKSRH